jgi:protein-histidine pros-kinase
MAEYDFCVERLPEEITRQLIIESFSEAIIIVNKKSEIIYCNRRMRELFEYSKEELYRKPLSILIPDVFKNIHSVQAETHFENPENRSMGIGMNLFGRKKDGTDLPVEVSLSTLKAENNTYIMAFISDISIRHKIENELIERNQELKSFAGMLSHDINSLMSGIVGFSDLLIESSDYPVEKQKEFLQNIGEENIAISSVTAGELIFGALNKRELKAIKKDIDNLVVLYIIELISRKFIELMFKYSKSHV